MKYFIISDIHSNLEALNPVLEEIDTEKPDIKICLGDIVGYGPNPDECVELIFSNFDIILAGNHDQAVTGEYSSESFNPLARTAVLWTQAKMKDENIARLKSLELKNIKNDITCVHATPTHPEEFGYILHSIEAQKHFLTLTTSICFIGHTHIPMVYIQNKDGSVDESAKKSITLKNNKKYIINVGSVGQPRDRNPLASYGVYDSETNNFDIKRLSYDIDSVQEKMKKAGLPPYLINRLSRGV